MALSSQDGVLETAFYGMAGGLVSAVTSHPLDTLKTRLQTGAGWGGMGTVRGLFRGLAAPVLSVPPAWAFNFMSYGFALRVFGDRTTIQHAAAGSVSGIIWGMCVSPFELVKCIAQNENRSSRQVWSDLLGGQGSSHRVAALCRGMQLAVLRDFIGCGFWFGGYHYASHTLETNSFVAGGIAGCSCWMTIFPVDTWKTVHQTSQTTLSQSLVKTRSYFQGKGGAVLITLLPIILLRQFVAMGSSMAFLQTVRSVVDGPDTGRCGHAE